VLFPLISDLIFLVMILNLSIVELFPKARLFSKYSVLLRGVEITVPRGRRSGRRGHVCVQRAERRTLWNVCCARFSQTRVRFNMLKLGSVED
jgi:hypothetical protein